MENLKKIEALKKIEVLESFGYVCYLGHDSCVLGTEPKDGSYFIVVL